MSDFKTRKRAVWRKRRAGESLRGLGEEYQRAKDHLPTLLVFESLLLTLLEPSSPLKTGSKPDLKRAKETAGGRYTLKFSQTSGRRSVSDGAI